MSFSKFLLLPTLIQSGIRAPRGNAAWERYWAGIRRTGEGGDVLWDGASAAELEWCKKQAFRYLNPTLPLIDLGAGNGRYARALASGFPRVVGLDVSPAAVARAQAESQGVPEVSFLTLDITRPDVGPALAAEFAPANVFVRGVFHVLDDAAKQAALANIRIVLGPGGSMLLIETAFPGSALEYLEFLGARSGKLPALVERCVRAGLPTPAPFGRAEFNRLFVRDVWEHVADGEVEVHAAGTHPNQVVQVIPGFFAVVRAVPRSAE